MFRSDRALALTAFFLERAGGRMNDIKLAKLQYLAERSAILRFHAPMTNDEGVSLEHGPCLRRTLDLTQGKRLRTEPMPDPLWKKHIAFYRQADGDVQDENTVELRQPYDWEQKLSPAEIATLEEIWRQFGAMTKWQIRDWCHDHCSEYREVEGRVQLPIRLEDIFRAAGDDRETAREKAEEIRYHERFAEELARERALAR